LNRSNLGKHVAFGIGVHRCIGAALSRMEIKVAAHEITKRIDNIKLAVPIEDIEYMPTVATRTIKKLPLTLSRRV
jgi:cytochrome P450